MIPITDQDEVEKLERLKVAVVHEPSRLETSWLLSKRWVVAPVESAWKFLERDAELLSRAFQASGHPDVFAIATEEVVEDFPRCFLVSTSKEDLIAYSDTCSPFNYVLLPVDRSVAILCTVDDFYLVAGPVEFVRTAVGGDLAEAWKLFREAASDPDWNGKLERIAKRYEDFSVAP
jgi:hypothetical protein